MIEREVLDKTATLGGDPELEDSMNIIIFTVVAIMCFSVGIKEYNSTEQSKIFSKYPIRVTDVKAYNQFCGKLIMGFGVVALITLAAMDVFGGIIGLIMMVLLIVEAIVVMKIYRKGEQKFMKK